MGGKLSRGSCLKDGALPSTPPPHLTVACGPGEHSKASPLQEIGGPKVSKCKVFAQRQTQFLVETRIHSVVAYVAENAIMWKQNNKTNILYNILYFISFRIDVWLLKSLIPVNKHFEQVIDIPLCLTFLKY